MFMWRFSDPSHILQHLLNIFLLHLPPPLPSSSQNRLRRFVELILDFNSELGLSTDIHTLLCSVFGLFGGDFSDDEEMLDFSCECPLSPQSDPE